MSIDLHIHSTYSDGTLCPAEIVTLAKAKGLSAISITDHDTMEGTAEALEAGSRLGLEVVPGIELSVVFGEQHLHLLAYGIDRGNDALAKALTDIQHARLIRNRAILQKLETLGLGVTIAELEKKSPIGQMGRPHIAQVLVEKKIASSMDDAFARFLKRGAVAYVPRKILTVETAINYIGDAGGIAVLAHPGAIDNSLRRIPALVAELIPLGLGGIEVYYPVHSSKNQKQLSTLAARYGLVVTGGSDYHGDIRPGTMLAGGKNVYVPYSVLQKLKERLGH